MFYVALTGGIASGKSTVCRLLEERGAHVIDSDVLAREVVRKGAPAWAEVVEHFGPEILTPEGEIDRGKLGEIVFSDPGEREFLNRVTHPRIFQLMGERMRELERRCGGEGVVVLDIPLLVEAGAGGLFHLNLVVDAPEEEQVRRLVEDRGFSPEAAWARVRSQASREERLACADLVIANDGSLEKLRSEVDRAWEEILARMEARRKSGG